MVRMNIQLLIITAILLMYTICHKSSITNWIKLPKTEIILCEEDVKVISCSAYEGLHILDAFWGRDSMLICKVPTDLKYINSPNAQVDNLMCFDRNTTYAKTKVKTLCEELQACQINADFSIFERKICPDVKKYLRVIYECRQLSGMKRHLINLFTFS